MTRISASDFIQLIKSPRAEAASRSVSSQVRIVGKDSAERVSHLMTRKGVDVDITSVVVNLSRHSASASVKLVGGFGGKAAASVNVRVAGDPKHISSLLATIPESNRASASAAVHLPAARPPAHSQVQKLRGSFKEVVGAIDPSAEKVSVRIRLRGTAPEIAEQVGQISKGAITSVSGKVSVAGSRFLEPTGLPISGGASAVSSARISLKGPDVHVASAIMQLSPVSGVVSFG